MLVEGVIAALVLTTVLKILWFFRLICLAHWSYIIANQAYPQNSKQSFLITTSLFSIFFISSLLPHFYFPQLSNFATAITILPQIHMLTLLLRAYGNINKPRRQRDESSHLGNENLKKIVCVYAGLTAVSIAWTMLSFLIG